MTLINFTFSIAIFDMKCCGILVEILSLFLSFPCYFILRSKGTGSFYIAQYPVRWVAQSAAITRED